LVLSDTSGVDELRTPRLLLRRWRAEDQPAMAQINRDPEVRRYLNRPVDEAAVAAFFGQIVGHWDEHGYGPWALECNEPGLKGRFLRPKPYCCAVAVEPGHPGDRRAVD
jgi:RimJ/RimL family protein N-acetyltransferase